jgi:hypothetical protein
MKKAKCYCYVCGTPVIKWYYLVTMKSPTDRVFICCTECINQVDESTLIIPITRD